jgi:hypothetical protein
MRPEGIFSISFKVKDINAASVHVESLGYKRLYLHDHVDIIEALFDTTLTLPFYIEFIQSPDEIENANFGEL